MQATAENLAFSGYLSRTKVTGFFVFMGACLACVVFGNSEGQTYFRWVFESWALPVRWSLILGLTLIELVYLRLMYLAFMSIPAVLVAKSKVTVNSIKTSEFAIADIDKIVNHNGEYHIRVGKKKYGVSPLVCLEPDALRENMRILMNIAASKSVF